MSDKIAYHHLRRRAVLYVRQSSQQQLINNEESRRLQYAMRERLLGLGFGDVEVIDDDLGRSAKGDVERPGFQRLVAEVSMGQVGAVGARELSRLARNSRDWQQLLEVCRYVDTLLVDHDAVYDVRHSNDRLLLGLKGNLNEYELEMLRVRAHEARRAKAQRGEYYARLPVGYRRSDNDSLEKTADRRVRQAIELVFEKMLEVGSARQVLLWLSAEKLQLPVGVSGDRVVWKDASYARVYDLLRNPAYAGAYAYGRSEISVCIVDGQPRRRQRAIARSKWKVLLWDHHEAYIEVATFERIQTMIDNNAQARLNGASGRATSGTGAARRGPALLAGLLRCRRCGRKLMVCYSNERKNVSRYECRRKHDACGAPACIGFSAIDVDARVGDELLAVVRPAAVEASLRAVAEDGATQDQALGALEAELEAAQYAVARAWRQYDAADPENRLVVDDLERRWNDALERAHDVERRVADRRAARPATAPTLDLFASLAMDLERVWNAPTTDAALKKRIARAVIEEVVVDIENDREIVVLIHWKGGVHTELRVAKRHRGQNRVSTSANAVDAIRALAVFFDDQRIASFLVRAGLKTAKGLAWSRPIVAAIRHARAIPPRSASSAEPWLTLQQAVELVRAAPETLQAAVADGDLEALHPLANGPWLFRRESLLAWNSSRRVRRGRTAPTAAQLDLAISPR
jgi:DNA invertase Pin-like site-specific DNA recombinase